MTNFLLKRPKSGNLRGPWPQFSAKLFHLWCFPNVTWDFWKFWFFAIFWPYKISKMAKMAKIWTLRAKKMKNITIFQKSQVTFGKHHKWNNLAKNWGQGPCRFLKVGQFRWKSVIFLKYRDLPYISRPPHHVNGHKMRTVWS